MTGPIEERSVVLPPMPPCCWRCGAPLDPRPSCSGCGSYCGVSGIPPVAPDLVCLRTAMLRDLCNVLPQYAYRFASEIELHAGLEVALTQMGVLFTREYRAGPDRFDFL